MYQFKTGNLLNCEAEAHVNTINTFGAMGKGIALQFKNKYPQMFQAYRIACQKGEVTHGKMYIFELPTENPKYIINFPTKRHWRENSRLEDIKSGLIDLAKEIKARGIKTVAIPALGCSNGGLDWKIVKPYIIATFDALPDVMGYIFEPKV